ncbi:myosin heavy chain [Cyclospora cayetanensis]|uniref:Myosin heavy chain n=1 Tax=Cyclospora cayetanensis TaxID=88456 RepID=A0A1D3D2M3_9EIME|nr:myosin heavy chain [Cyclospora cayetanensis]
MSSRNCCRGEGNGGAVHLIPVGSLAWTHSTEEGFETVKVLGHDMSTGLSRVEVHPEGSSSIAASLAAVAAVCDAQTLAATGQTSCSLDSGVKEQSHAQVEHDSSKLRPPAGKRKTGPKKNKSSAWVLEAPIAATEAFTDPLSPRGSQRFRSSSGESDTDSEHDPYDASEAGTEAFPSTHLWPYNAPPMPPHPIPDDTASYGTLSAAALLQQLQHRYLRNEIYTYAAHVLLAVNPYKPLPHLYSTQQILLYRHWRKLARAYRRQLNEEQCSNAKEVLSPCSPVSSGDAISILNRLPGILPLRSLPSRDGPPRGSGNATLPKSVTETSSRTANNSIELGATTGIGKPEALAAATEQAFKECTARQNRPPPHPYVVAEEALRRLVGTQISQTIVVSGQSGAGKTETSKQLMLFLTHASTSADSTSEVWKDGTSSSSDDPELALTLSERRRQTAALTGGVQTLSEAAELRQRIVSCNAIFESFGNAATRRNHNSSRIGRLTLLHFDNGGLLRGGSLRTYLLEAARITAHKRGDRNFHVFYQLLRAAGRIAASGASEELRISMGLNEDTDFYNMLQPQDSHKFLQKVFLKESHQDACKAPSGESTKEAAQVPKAVDQQNFEALVEALKRADFSSGEVDELLQLLAGLLHLSNVSFTKGNDDSLELRDTTATEALTHAASLLGVEKTELEDLLKFRRMILKGDVLVTLRSQQQSSSACCSLIKFVYCRLFDHIVNRLNGSTARELQGRQRYTNSLLNKDDSKSLKFIGILDIYGFECFGLENGLEQLCINYANEKQQELFVKRVIEEEIALYTREGISNPAITVGHRRYHHIHKDGYHEQQQLGRQGNAHATFKKNLEQSLFASLPDTSVLLRDLQEGVFRRLDDSCRLLAQGQARDDIHFWRDLFAYCTSSKQQLQQPKASSSMLHTHREQQATCDQYLLFCLKGLHGMRVADAAASGKLLQHLQHSDLSSIGLVTAQQLSTRGAEGAAIGNTGSGKVQERVFAVKHFAGTVLYGTDGWLDLNKDRIEHELERLVAKSQKSFLREAMEQHEAMQQQEGAVSLSVGGGQFSSITKRFVKSVKELSQELTGPLMQLHFIRCFIPNGCMKPNSFERKVVLQQLQHSGTLALVDILHSGFPHRLPLHPVASKLRTVLVPLLKRRLQEQEDKVKQLAAQKEQQSSSAEESASFDQEVARQRRILETLRHCNPATTRDRTLVSATLGLLSKCRPGSFICGVSLICFKGAAYGEATEFMADPSQFFKTPEDLCRLITAIQRLRWRVAARIVLQVHPTLLWLQRRACLMRKIKMAAVTLAIRMLLLKKFILRPLRERVRRRLALRRGVRTLEHMFLQRGFKGWQRYASVLRSFEGAKKAAASPPGGERDDLQSSISNGPTLDLSKVRSNASGGSGGDEYQIHPIMQYWNTCLFPLKSSTQHELCREHQLALHPGRDLYSIHFSDPLARDLEQPFSEHHQNPEQLRPESLRVCSFAEQKQTAQQQTDLSVAQALGGENTAPPTACGPTKGAPLVTVAKHPSYDLFLASDSAAQLLLFSTPGSAEPETEEGDALDGVRQGHVRNPPTTFGEPSTCLPCLASPSNNPLPPSSSTPPSSTGIPFPKRANKHPNVLNGIKKLPALPECLRHCESNERSFPTSLLPKKPLPPSKWLPRDLLKQVSEKLQQPQSSTPRQRVPTVRPLRVAFASPLTADFAIVVCLVQGNSRTQASSRNIGKLIVVLVDLVEGGCRGWVPLALASHDISACACRHAEYLKQVDAAALSLTSTHCTSSNSTADEDPPAVSSQRSASRSRSTMLSTIRLQPLWGSMWAVVGPSLLAIFSVNLRFFQHPPTDLQEQHHAKELPLRLLWNMASIPHVKGPSFEVAQAWFTGCTYTRIAPSRLSSITGTHPVIQVLQMMPYGTVTRSIEAKMQRLLLLSTADNSLLLLRWSERSTDTISGLGNLVLLHQLQLPSSVLQFLRQVPEDTMECGGVLSEHKDAEGRLKRSFPWDSEALLLNGQADEATQSYARQRNNGSRMDSDGSTIEGMSESWESDGYVAQSQPQARDGVTCTDSPSLTRDFQHYGIALVEKSTGRIVRSLDQHTLQQLRDGVHSKSQILAVTPLLSSPGVLVSIQCLRPGVLSLCAGDEAGNWKEIGDLDLYN